MLTSFSNQFLASRADWRLSYTVSVVMLIAGILVRLVDLSADPQSSEWLGYITDEGRWVRHGRSLALHGYLADANNLHLVLAPMFQLSNYLVFEIAGVTLWSSRLVSALSGAGLLILFWAFFRRALGPEAFLLALTLLACQSDLVALSRFAVPEMTLIAFQLAIYFMIVSSEKSAWRMAAAGALAVFAVAVKMTMLLSLPIFFIMIIAMPRRVRGGAARWRDLSAFAIGLALPAALAGLAYFFFLADSRSLSDITRQLSTAAAFLRLSNFYSIISFPFDHSLALTFNLWALGLWLSGLAWMAGGREILDFPSQRYLATSAVWFLLYFLMMVSLDYFPTRYKIHILLPMALIVGFGISLLHRLGFQRIVEKAAEVQGPFGMVWMVAMSFPSAATLAPLLIPGMVSMGLDAGQLWCKLWSFFAALVVSMGLLYQCRSSQRLIRFFLVLPFAGGLVWGLVSTFSEFRFWPTSGGAPAPMALWLVILAGAAAIAWFGNSRMDRRASTIASYLLPLGAMLYLAISLIGVLPCYRNPGYSMRDASRALNALLAGSHTIASVGADGLFNENNLRYESLSAPEFNVLEKKPDVVVVAFYREAVKYILDRDYQLVQTFVIAPSPAWYNRAQFKHDPLGVVVTVHRKNSASASNQLGALR